MDIREFRYFESVARNKQFILAAEELHITQPSLSNAIKRLEQDVGFKLFKRSTKRLSLTESGEIFYRHAIRLLNHYDTIMKELKDIERVGSGELRIGMIESFEYWIPHIIKQFKHVYPNINIQIKEMSPTEIEKALKNYDIHLGITTNIKDEAPFIYIPIIRDNLSLITPTNHKFKDLKKVDITALKEEVFIHSLSGYGIRKTIEEACMNNGFNLEIQYETESLETACNLVEVGVGVSVVPESYLKLNASKNVHLLHFKNKIPERMVSVAYMKDRYLPVAYQEFISIIKELSDENFAP